MFSIIGAMLSSPRASPPAPPPATVIAPVVPSPVAPAKRHAHSSKRAIAQGLPNPSARKTNRTPHTPPHPASDAVPRQNASASLFIAFESRREDVPFMTLLTDKDFRSQFDTEDPAKPARHNTAILPDLAADRNCGEAQLSGLPIMFPILFHDSRHPCGSIPQPI